MKNNESFLLFTIKKLFSEMLKSDFLGILFIAVVQITLWNLFHSIGNFVGHPISPIPNEFIFRLKSFISYGWIFTITFSCLAISAIVVPLEFINDCSELYENNRG